MTLSFSFAPTKDDYLKAFRAFYFSNPSTWLGLMSLLLSVPTVALCVLASLKTNSNVIIWLPIVFFLFLAFFFTFLLVVNPILIGNKVEKNQRLSSPVNYQVSDEEIVIKDQLIENKLDWSSFQKVIESKNHFLLVLSTHKNAFEIIPKRAFASSDDEQAFKRLLIAKNLKVENSPLDIKKNPLIVVALIVVLSLLICGTLLIYVVYRAASQY